MNVAQTRSDAARRWAAGWRPEVWLFDFDGTLADSLDLIMASFRHATGRVLGAPLDDMEGRVMGINTMMLTSRGAAKASDSPFRATPCAPSPAGCAPTAGCTGW